MITTLSGQRVPKGQRPVFFGTHKFLEKWLWTLEAIVNELQTTEDWPGAELIDKSFVKEQIETARRHVMDALPYAICDCYGEAGSENCDLCEGRGWLTAKQALESSEE